MRFRWTAFHPRGSQRVRGGGGSGGCSFLSYLLSIRRETVFVKLKVVTCAFCSRANAKFRLRSIAVRLYVVGMPLGHAVESLRKQTGTLIVLRTQEIAYCLGRARHQIRSIGVSFHTRDDILSTRRPCCFSLAPNNLNVFFSSEPIALFATFFSAALKDGYIPRRNASASSFGFCRQCCRIQ